MIIAESLYTFGKKDWLKTNFSWWVDENLEKTGKELAKNQQLLENQQKTGKKPNFPKSEQTFSYLGRLN